MSLRDLPTKPSFNTSTDQILESFIVPALARAIRYDRGVGFFTSEWVRLAATGLSALASAGGKARIVASPKLSRDDWDALLKGYDARADAQLAAAMRSVLDELETGSRLETLATLAWMVADGLLDFKIAIPARELDGDFHDKFGVFVDSKNDMVAFRGSPNDSERAFRNYESISVYYSWVDEREAARAIEEEQRFDRIWENRDPNLRVHGIPDAFRRGLVQLTTRFERPYRSPLDGRSHRWRHQGEALGAFLEARRGVLEMATGTGKTRTALSILDELRRRDAVAGAIVCAYGTDLLDQWYRELLTRTDLPIYREYAEHRESLGYLNGDDSSVLLISRQNLVDVLPKLPAHRQQRSLLICDEVHGMGSSAMVEALSARLDGFVYRLGLSATPERAYDAAGNDFVEANIGPVIYRFTLEQAIARGILCEFDYVDLEYEFSDEDKAAVRQAIRKHFARAGGPDPQPQEQLFQELARIRKLSQEKLAPFRAYAAGHIDILRRSLIFVETAEYGFLVQQILMDLGLDFHTYYGDDDRANLRRFADGELECLVTCKRISEGIDISSVGAIVLFASARARLETVQRLGRCLRIDPANPDKRATVVDFIRTDDLEDSEINPETTADEDRRIWFQALAQVRRIDEDLAA